MAESNDSWIVHSPRIIQTAPVISTGDSSFTDLPYFLHHSDNLGTMLVSHPLTGDNYTTWSHAMHIVLCAKNKIHFVDGSLSRPASTEPTSPSWERCITIVFSWLLNALSKDLADSVVYTTTAYEVWNDLRDRYAQRNAPCIFLLKKLIANFQQDQHSIASSFTKMKNL